MHQLSPLVIMFIVFFKIRSANKHHLNLVDIEGLSDDEADQERVMAMQTEFTKKRYLLVFAFVSYNVS